MELHPTHLVLIPSYNTGPRLAATVDEALRAWAPVWVVIDGSTDGSDRPVRSRAASDPRLRILSLPENRGKGAAIEAGVRAALEAGYSHALTMDSDGQHPAALIPAFMAASLRQPRAMILGRPIFGPEAPAARRHGRKLSIALARAQTLGAAVDDPLFGFRVYPLAALRNVFDSTRWARRFDFDHEAAVRAFWEGVPAVNLPAPCRYLSRAEGGVSHFRYGRDNVRLAWLQLRLLAELLLWRWPEVRRLRRIAAPRPVRQPVLMVAVLAAAAAAGLPRTEAPIRVSSPGWSRVFAGLALHADRESQFTETRYLPFRSRPIVLTGEARISARRGLSLDYRTPRREVLIVDARGLLAREPDGRQHALPDAGPVSGAVSTLLDLLRFDPADLERRFHLTGALYGSAWTMELRPRKNAASCPFAAVILSGEDGRLRSIQLIKSASEHVDIALSHTANLAAFGPDVAARYFR